MRLPKLFLAVALSVWLCCAAGSPAGAEYDMNQPQNLEASHLFAESALLVDQDTGEVLFSKDSRVRMYPASTTKIMTLLLGLESGIGLEDEVTIPAEAGDVPEGSSVVPVKPGDVTSFEDLLYGFMLSSGNDGANAVAVLVDGSIGAFVEHMNRRAAEIGCESTHYVNPHGYHDPEHYTTAQDLALISLEAMKNPVFRRIVAAPKWTMSLRRDGEAVRQEIISRNTLLQSDEKYYYEDCTGIKTGHHNKAGWCFVGSAERDGMRLICVVLKCEEEMSKWYDAARLFEYGFTRYEWVSAGTLIEAAWSRRYSQIQLEDADPADEQGGSLELDLDVGEGDDASVPVIAGSEASLNAAVDRLVSVEWEQAFVAPIGEGDVMGTLTCDVEGVPATATLVASRSVAARPEPTPTPEPESTEDVAAPTAPAPAAPQPAPRRGSGLVIAAILALLLSASAIAIVAGLKRAERRRARARRRRARRGVAQRSGSQSRPRSETQSRKNDRDGRYVRR